MIERSGSRGNNFKWAHHGWWLSLESRETHQIRAGNHLCKYITVEKLKLFVFVLCFQGDWSRFLTMITMYLKLSPEKRLGNIQPGCQVRLANHQDRLGRIIWCSLAAEVSLSRWCLKNMLNTWIIENYYPKYPQVKSRRSQSLDESNLTAVVKFWCCLQICSCLADARWKVIRLLWTSNVDIFGPGKHFLAFQSRGQFATVEWCIWTPLSVFYRSRAQPDLQLVPWPRRSTKGCLWQARSDGNILTSPSHLPYEMREVGVPY